MAATTLTLPVPAPIEGPPPTAAARPIAPSLPVALHAAAPQVRLSGERRALIEAMWSAPARGWQLVPGIGLTVQWDRQMPTPAWAREPGGWDWRSEAAEPLWAEATYPQRVIVMLSARSAMPVLGLWRAPWAVRLDQPVTLARALAVLADPGAALDDPETPYGQALARRTPALQESPRQGPARGDQRGASPEPGHQPEDPPYKVIGGIVYLTRASR